MKDKKIEVGLVEDDEDFARGIADRLHELPEVAKVHTWPSAEAYWRDRKGRKLDLLFLDILLGAMNGVELAGRVADQYPEINIVMLSNLNSDAMVFQALRNGAIGYILKNDLEDIGETVRTILSGGATITPTIALRVLTSFRQSNPVAQARLTPREKQILELMVKGKTSRAVADILDCSLNTVLTHTKNIYKKLNVHNRMELARKAAAAGLLNDDPDEQDH